MGDLVRGALTSIEKNQVESAQALGLTSLQTFRYILLPQSLKRVTTKCDQLIYPHGENQFSCHVNRCIGGHQSGTTDY